jgi:hypothetical protein
MRHLTTALATAALAAAFCSPAIAGNFLVDGGQVVEGDQCNNFLSASNEEKTYLNGGRGDDVLTTGPHADVMVGGHGSDVFIAGPGDFVDAREDTLRPNWGRGSDKIFALRGDDAANDPFILYDADDSIVYFDVVPAEDLEVSVNDLFDRFALDGNMITRYAVGFGCLPVVPPPPPAVPSPPGVVSGQPPAPLSN